MQTFKGVLNYILPSAPKNTNSADDTAHEAYLTYQNPNDETGNTRPATASTAEGGAEGGGSVPAGDTKKRAFEIDSQGSEPKRKRLLPGDHEQRLLGDYGRPSDGQPLIFSAASNDRKSDSRRSEAMAVKPGGGRGIRPQNTLGSSPHTAHQRFAGARKEGPTQRSTGSVQGPGRRTGINVPFTSTQNGDGFEPHERPAKLRKLATGQSKDTSQSAGDADRAIDLTDDSVIETKVLGRNGKLLHSGNGVKSSTPLVSQPPPPLFDGSEWRTTDDATRVKPPKPRRKKSDGHQSSQSSRSSARATPAEPSNGSLRGQDRPGPQAAVEAVADDEIKYVSQRSGDHKPEHESKRKPPINLGNGVDPVVKKEKKLPKGKQAEDTNDFLRAEAGRTHGRAVMPHRLPTDSGHRQRREIRQSDDEGVSLSYVNGDERPRPKTPPLSKQFVRVDDVKSGTREQPKQRASERMKATSEKVETRVSPIDDGSSSADELAGDNTVKSRASGRTCPVKKDIRVHRERPTRQRKGSASDLKTTRFGPDARRTEQQNAESEAATAPTDADDAEAVPIQAFYATSCVETTGPMSLRFDEKSEVIEFLADGETRRVPNQNCTVHIGDSEAHKVQWNGSSKRVYIYGSAGRVSNGHICIAFQDIEGVSWFIHKIFVVNNLATFDHVVNISRLDNIFLNKVQDISVRARQSKQQADLIAQYNSARQREQDDEEIKYEPEEPRPTTSRKGLPGENVSGHRVSVRLSSESQGMEQSRFFTTPETRRSTRHGKTTKLRPPSPPPPVKWTQENQPERWAHSVVYPSEGARRVTVDFQDLERLDEGEFLNDNIISFALRRIEETMAPEHKESVYFFNTFFYTALSTTNGKKAFNYDAVKRWTKNKDLLTVPYIVVPININFHWFVAIICNLPNITRKAAALEEDDTPSVGQDSESRSGESNNDTLAEAASGDHSRKRLDREPTQAMDQLSLSDGNEKAINTHVDTNGGLETPCNKGRAGAKRTRKRSAPTPKKYDPDLATIITLDSLGGGHTGESRYLKEYVMAEADAKRGMTVELDELPAMTAKGIPEQTNFCDCGVYLVGYVEEFAKNPRKFVTKVLTRQMDEQADFATFDASAKRADIRNELLKLQAQQEAEHKAKRSAKKVAKSGGPALTGMSPKRTEAKVSDVPDRAHISGPHRGLETAIHEPLSIPSPQAEIAQHSATREAANGNEEDDDLELDVPRPLQNSVSYTAAAKDRPSSSTSQRESGHDHDEILDQAEVNEMRQDDDEEVAAHGAPGNELLNQLWDAVHEGDGNRERQPDGSSDQEHSPVKGQGARDGRQHVQSFGGNIVNVEDEEERLMEVPDSQGKDEPRPYPSWAGTRQRFPD
ncbi:hypothetical protein LTR37_007571 [Vermiconidia calcicola]|uniref:Uncharacterized protein n=1 Tax=Vermiconidia calcicola TaxID=1690605 RepID=A0ACC3NDU4_9PEZI|nr:hypothetical protein LTR37_007571 [Vermiconidia calcicola]